MPIMTYAATPTRGSQVSVTLDKSLLAAITSVSADSYYSNTSNWKQIILYFRSSESNQKEIVFFDATQATPVSSFKVSSTSLGDFLIDRIVIKDFDSGVFKVERSELNASEFDAIFTITGFSETLKSASISLSDENQTATRIGETETYAEAYVSSGTDISSGGKYYCEFIVNGFGSNFFQYAIGYMIVSNEQTIIDSLQEPTRQNPFGWALDTGIDSLYTFMHQSSVNYRSDQGASQVSTSMPVFNLVEGDRVMLAFDADNQKTYMGLNGNWGGGVDPELNQGGLTTVPTQSILYPAVYLPPNGASATLVTEPLYLPSGFTLIS